VSGPACEFFIFFVTHSWSMKNIISEFWAFGSRPLGRRPERPSDRTNTDHHSSWCCVCFFQNWSKLEARPAPWNCPRGKRTQRYIIALEKQNNSLRAALNIPIRANPSVGVAQALFLSAAPLFQLWTRLAYEPQVGPAGQRQGKQTCCSSWESHTAPRRKHVKIIGNDANSNAYRNIGRLFLTFAQTQRKVVLKW